MNNLVVKGALLAAIAQLAQMVASTDLHTITDWRAWLVSLTIAAVYRAARVLMTELDVPTPPPAG